MKIVAVIPMKLNNSRLPGKNIKKFSSGKPLCEYILRTVSSIELIDEIYVYCSNESINNYIPDNVHYLNRPTYLDSDNTSMNMVLKSFANDISADVYIMSHATSPFITSRSICIGIDAVLNKGYDSAFAVKKVQDFFWKENQPFNYSLENIPRTQDLSPLFQETSGFYIYKSEVINNLNRRIGNNPFLVEVSEIESIDIDEEEDFIIANAIDMINNS